MPTITADGKYYVDMGDDPLFTGGSFVSIYPEQLSFDDQIRGVGNCNFQISFSAKDQDGATVVSGHDVFGPYRTYYRLRYGDIAIQAGVLTSWRTALGDDFMSCACKTWEHFLERWQYPFDPRTTELVPGDPTSAPINAYVFPNTFVGDEVTGSGVATPTGLVYQASNRDAIAIISDILSTSMNVGNRVIFDLSSLTGLSGVKTNYQLSLGDRSYMFSLINDLSNLGQGFDWWISHDMKFLWASPFRFGNVTAPTISFTFDGLTDSAKPDSLEFENIGPRGTHILGTGAGLATGTTLATAYGAPNSQDVFTRLDVDYDFGDIRNADQLALRTHKQFSYDLNPQHNIPITVNPGRIPNFWSTFRKGRAIYIDYELIAHRIDSPHQLVSYSANVSNEGEASVDFTISQIYDVSSSVGIPEG